MVPCGTLLCFAGEDLELSERGVTLVLYLQSRESEVQPTRHWLYSCEIPKIPEHLYLKSANII